MIQVSDLLVLNCFKLLLEILMGHDIVVSTQGLNNLFSVLIDSDRLAEIVVAAFICQLV